MRWHIKRTKLLFALFPIISIVFFIFTANGNLYAEQSFMAFDIYQQISDVMTPVEGKDSPSDYTAAENFAIAAGVYLATDSVQSTTVGSAVALGGFYTQNVTNYRSKTGGELFQESISLSGIVSLAEQRYFKNGALLYRKGNASGGKLKSWSDNITELSDAVYRQRYGIIPQEITKYSVTSNSIISGKFVSSADDSFTYELVLDAAEAWKYSQYEMMTYAGTSKYPEFDSCRIVYTIDSQWRILEMQMYDVYSVNVSVGNVKCTSTLTETFSYTEGYMPERAQPLIDYVPTGNTSGSIDTEKGPADYLGEAYGDYISGEKILYADATVNLLDEVIKVTAAIDVKNNDYRFTIGDNVFAAYKNDTLYLSLGQNKYYLGTSDLTSLLGLFGLDFGGDSEDGSGLLDAGLLDVLFENHEITETDTHVNINMPFELTGINIDVTMGLKKTDDGATVADTISAEIAYGDISVSVNARIADYIELPELNENDYRPLKPILDSVVNTAFGKTFKADLRGEISTDEAKEEFTASVNLDITDGIKAQGYLRVSGVNAEFAYIDNTVYVKLNDIGFKLDLSDAEGVLNSVTDAYGSVNEFINNISGLLGETKTAEIEKVLTAVDDVIAKLGERPDKDEIINNLGFIIPELNADSVFALIDDLAISDDGIELTITPRSGTPYTVSVSVANGYVSGASVNGLNVSGYTLNLNAAVTCGKEYDISVDESEYADLAVITRLTPALTAILKSNVIELGDISGLLNSSVISGMISGNAYISLNPLCLVAELTFRTHNVSLRYENDVIYVAINDIRIKFAMSDIDSLIDEISKYMTESEAATVAEVISEGLKYTSLIQNALGGKTLAEIVSCITHVSDYDNGGITVVFSAGDFNASVNLYATNTSLTIDAYNVNYGADIYDSNICVTVTPLNAMPAFAFDEDSYVNLAEIQSYIAPVMNMLRQRYFSLTFGGGVLDRKNEATTVSGQLKVELTKGFANIYVNILLGGKTGDQSIEVYLLDTTDYENADGFDLLNLTAYINYNGFNAKIDCKSALRIVGAIRSILNLDIPMLDGILEDVADETLDTSVFETFEIAGLDDLRDALNSIFSLAGNIQGGASGGINGILGLLSDTMLDSILGGVSIQFENSLLKINIDNGLFDNTLSGKKASVVIGHDGELLTYVQIANLIANGDTVNFTANLSCEEFAPITPPEGNNIKDFTSLDDLLFTVIKTASLREFEITGEIALNLLGIVKPEIPFDIKVKILDDGTTVAAVKMEVPYKVGGMLKRTNSYIYFVNDMLYFVVDVWNNGAFSAGSYKTTEMKSATIDEFLSNPIDYLFYLIRMADLAESQIKNAISGAGGGTPSTDLNQILKTYSYADNKYTFKIGLKELSGSSDLNDLNVVLSTTPDGYVSGLSLDTQFTNMNITLALNNTTLSNLDLNPDGTVSGTKDMGFVDFGLGSAASPLKDKYAIDNLEDAMAVLFPVEAAETFGVKAAKKADKATQAAAEATAADKAVNTSKTEMQDSNAKLTEAREKLASIPEDSFGYSRAEAQVKLAEQAARQAEDAYAAAIQNRITKAQEAIDAARSAYYYAQKAAEYAETASSLETVRSYAAAGSAAQATVYAMQSTTDALVAAVNAATSAGDDGTAVLNAAQALLEEINESIPTTATRAARAAQIACRQTATEAVTLSNKAASYAESCEWFTASQYAADALDTINAMITATQAATEAARLSGNDELISETNENAANVNEILNNTVTKTANAAISAANAIAADGKNIIDAALTDAKENNCESSTLKIKEALDYAEKAIIAARGATNAAMLIDDETVSENAQTAAKAATNAAEYIGNNALDAIYSISGIYSEQIQNASTDLSGINSAAGTLTRINELIDIASAAKQYAGENASTVIKTIYTVAAKSADTLLRRANTVLYSAAVNYANSVNTAVNNALNKSFGTTAYSDVQNYSNAITNAANEISEIASALQSAVKAVNGVYSKTYALLSDDDYAEFYALLTETLTGDSGLESASVLLQNAAISAQNGSAKMVTASNSLKWSASDFFGSAMNSAKSAATDCESAANSAKESADLTVESLNELISLYNGISR